MSDYDIFVSYSHQDRDRVHRLVAALSAEGWRVFLDRTIPPGASWRSFIGVPLAAAPVVIVCWTRDSIKSDWVGEEADAAATRQALIPVLLDEVRPPLGLSRIHAADLVSWLADGGGTLPAVLKSAIVNRLAVRTDGGTTPSPNVDAIERLPAPRSQSLLRRWPVAAGIAAVAVGLAIWGAFPSGGGGAVKVPTSTPPPTKVAGPSLASGIYDQYELNRPTTTGAIVQITMTSSDEFAIRGVGQAWSGRGKVTGHTGYYDWTFSDGRSGRATFTINADSTLTGHVLGSGLDWWWHARRRP